MGTLKTPAEQWIENAQHADEVEVIRLLQNLIEHYRTSKGSWPTPELLPWAGTVGISHEQHFDLLVHLSATHAWAWDWLLMDFIVLHQLRKPIPPALAEWLVGNLQQAFVPRVQATAALKQARKEKDFRAFLRAFPFFWNRIGAPVLPRPADRTGTHARDFWIWLAYRYLIERGNEPKQARGIIFEWGISGIAEATIKDVTQRWERDRPDRAIAQNLSKNSRTS